MTSSSPDEPDLHPPVLEAVNGVTARRRQNLTAIRFSGTGSSTPAASIHNDDFAAMGIETTDEWIFARTGIQ